jgi:transposase-like protein
MIGGRLMADWNKIKTEYITTDTSYRKLAEKHGVGESTLFTRASKEKWVEQKEQHQSKTVAKTLDAISKKQVDRATRLITVADKLLTKVESLIESDDKVLLDTQGMKHISGVLKDIKEIQMIKSDADMREQEARIANLRKQAESEDDDNEIQVIFTGRAKEYAK